MLNILNRRHVTAMYEEGYHFHNWGGYVIETNEGPIYVGITDNHARRFREHRKGWMKGGLANGSSKFMTFFNGPKRVLELFFCETREQAVAWEKRTCTELQTVFPNRLVYNVNKWPMWYEKNIFRSREPFD